MAFYIWRMLAFTSIIYLFSSFVHAGCYLPNGTEINQLRNVPYDNWLPCKKNGDSMCCRTNGTSPDTCTSNGLCHNSAAPNIWRESCTDPTWQSPACLRLCIQVNAINTGNPNWPDGTPVRNSHVPVTKCQDGSFCCGNNNTHCCSAGQGVFIVNGQVSNSKPSASSASASKSSASKSAAPSSASSTGSLGSDSSSNSGSSSSHTGAIAGGVVGGVLGLALVAGAIWFLLRRRRTSHNTPKVASELDSAETQRHELGGTSAGHARSDVKPPMNQGPGMTELPGTHELPAR